MQTSYQIMEALDVANTQSKFEVAFKKWDPENYFSGSWTLSAPGGKQFRIEQWYAQQSVSPLYGPRVHCLDGSHLYSNIRVWNCSKDIPEMDITCQACHAVAEGENNTGLTALFAVDH